MEKHYHNNTAAIKLAISSFIKYCDVTVVDRTTIETSIASAFEDFEDGMQNACAVECKADYIVTRKVDDFEASTLKVVTPTEFLNILISVLPLFPLVGMPVYSVLTVSSFMPSNSNLKYSSSL